MIKYPNPSLEFINAWYLDSCTSRYICKNRDLFFDLRPKDFEFIMAGKEPNQSREVGIVYLSLQNRKMTLLNITYTPKCDSNLISFGQLHKSGISYYDHPDSMILKKRGSQIGLVVRNKNVFILETESDKAMLVQEEGSSIYPLSSDLQTRLWHRQIGYINIVRVTQASKLVDRIKLGKY